MLRQARGKADVVVAFFTERHAFERRIEVLGRMVFPAGGLWIAWPKRAAKVATTMNEDVVREVALPLGLVDNKVCAIDASLVRTPRGVAARAPHRSRVPRRR